MSRLYVATSISPGPQPTITNRDDPEPVRPPLGFVTDPALRYDPHNPSEWMLGRIRAEVEHPLVWEGDDS